MRQFYCCFKIGYSLCSELSVRELERLIKTNTYEREKSNQITYEDNKKNIDVSILKEPYILDFLNLSLN